MCVLTGNIAYSTRRLTPLLMRLDDNPTAILASYVLPLGNHNVSTSERYVNQIGGIVYCYYRETVATYRGRVVIEISIG